MQTFTMYIGLSGSGKSTLAENQLIYKTTELNRKVAYLSSDEIRKELFGDENDQSHNVKVFEEMFKRTRRALIEGEDVIYDATNLSSKRRRNFLKQLNTFNIKKECILVIAPFYYCVNRQYMRGRQVPREVLKKQIESFQCPYYYEGWDSIKIKWTGYEYIGDILLKNNIPHDNPHHSLNILEHMYKARELFLRNELDKDILGDVILLHDIGKYFTKTIDENGIAKYYNHQNVGAYFLLCDRTLYENCSKDNLLYAACLIQWHMEFFLREEKGLKRLREMIGENMWRDLNLLHRYDLLAH